MLTRLFRLISMTFLCLIVAALGALTFAPSVDVFTYIPAAPAAQIERDILAYDTRTQIATRLVRGSSILNYDVSQEGQTIVYAARFLGETQLTLLDIFTNEKHILLSDDVYDPAFSPDGKWVAYRHQGRGERGIWIIPTLGGEPQRITSLPRGFAWSPDSTHIMYSDNTPNEVANTVFAVNITTLEETRLLNTSIYPTMMVWSEDALILLNTYQLYRYGLDNEPLNLMSRDNTLSAHPRLSPDGQQVIVAYSDMINDRTGIILYDVAGAYRDDFTPPRIFIGSNNPGGVRVGDAVDWWLQGE